MLMRIGTAWSFVVALFLAVISYGCFVAVHTYCENRPVNVVLSVAGASVIYFLMRSWPVGGLRRVAAVLAILICILEIIFNVWFFSWATKVCAEQKRLPSM